MTTEGSRQARRKLWGFRLVLVVFGLAAGGLVAELGARFLLGETAFFRVGENHVEDSGIPGVPWVYKRNVSGLTNNLGLVDVTDRSKKKPVGTYRVLVLGDSVSSVVQDFDSGDSRPYLWPHLLERKLEERLKGTPPVEVLNLSVSGLSLAQEMLLLEARGFSFQPDLIVFAYCENDPVETDVGRLWNLDRLASVSLALRQTYLREMNARELWYQPGHPILARLEQSFSKLGELAREHRVLILGLPVLSNEPGAQHHLEAIAPLAEREGLVLLDPRRTLAPSLRAFRSKRHPHDVLHMTATGHEAIAEYMSDALVPVIRTGNVTAALH